MGGSFSDGFKAGALIGAESGAIGGALSGAVVGYNVVPPEVSATDIGAQSSPNVTEEGFNIDGQYAQGASIQTDADGFTKVSVQLTACQAGLSAGAIFSAVGGFLRSTKNKEAQLAGAVSIMIGIGIGGAVCL